VAHVWLIALASAATYILGHDYDTCKYPARWRIPLQRTILKLSLQRENAKSTSNRVRACGQRQIRSEAIPANKGVLRTETLACIAISPRLQRWSSDPELLIFLAEPPTFVREGSAFRRGARREARAFSSWAEHCSYIVDFLHGAWVRCARQGSAMHLDCSAKLTRYCSAAF
jgi:hypothetical protein